MSYQVGSTCYPSPAAAAQASSSAVVGSIVPLGSALYVVDVQAVSDTSITYSFSDVQTSTSFTKVAPFTAAPCGLLDTSDGILIGWGVALAWIVTAAVVHMKRGVHT